MNDLNERKMNEGERLHIKDENVYRWPKNLKPNKAPGPDGINQTFKNIVVLSIIFTECHILLVWKTSIILFPSPRNLACSV